MKVLPEGKPAMDGLRTNPGRLKAGDAEQAPESLYKTQERFRLAQIRCV